LKTQRTGIVVFLFGAPGEIRSNAILKKIAEETSRAKGFIIFSQRGISFNFDIGVEYADGNDETPTLKIADQAAEWAWRKGLDKIIIVAASPHVDRCARDIKLSLGEKRLWADVSICPETRLYDGLWFCKASKQLRTRSRLFWRAREWMAMALPFQIYKRVAG
jgi:hypothetical protein